MQMVNQIILNYAQAIFINTEQLIPVLVTDDAARMNI
jgi:hypothetical protein